MRARVAGLALAAAVAAATTGCGLGLLQTARTTDPGRIQTSLGMGVLENDMMLERGVAPENLPVQVGVRVGVTEQLDLGAALLLGAGGMVDAKYNLLSRSRRLAVSLQAGVGGAANVVGSSASIVHVPLRALVSRDLPAGVTPYGGVGYGCFWVFGYGNPVPGVRYAARTGTGDGVLMVTAGLQLFSNRRVHLLLEYDFWEPVVDDPGDFYEVARSHIVLAGLQF